MYQVLYILLDIDGVMVPAKSWKAPELLKDGFPAFTDAAVRSLNKILERTRATIVLTTSHRDRFSELEWSGIFLNRGISARTLAITVMSLSPSSKLSILALQVPFR